jgi:hypothetical protein
MSDSSSDFASSSVAGRPTRYCGDLKPYCASCAVAASDAPKCIHKVIHPAIKAQSLQLLLQPIGRLLLAGCANPVHPKANIARDIIGHAKFCRAIGHRCQQRKRENCAAGHCEQSLLSILVATALGQDPNSLSGRAKRAKQFFCAALADLKRHP